MILLLATPTATLAAWDGFRRHRHPYPVTAAMAGLALLAAGLAAHEGLLTAVDSVTGDRLLTTLGAIGLASAHIVNWRLRHRKGHSL